MLAAWPFICLLLFVRLRAPQALLASVLGGYLLLPSATKFDLKGLPDLDKSSMIAIGVGMGVLFFTRRTGRLGGSLLFYGLGTIYVLSPFVTAFLNPDPIVGQRLFFPAMTWYDGLAAAGVNLFALVPYWAGRRVLADEAGHAAIIRAIVIAMLAYSLLVLLEIRLSPQLHRWVYGFFPHSFAQQVRAGGFRAVVFLSHGLVVAVFLGLGLIAAAVMARRNQRLYGVSGAIWALYLLAVVLMQKSLGAAITALAFGAVVVMCNARRQVALAALTAILVTGYPIVRGSHWLPLDAIQRVTTSFSSDRASSLNVRLENEEQLLAKASERALFGWGGWGRNRIYDLEEGRDRSITDGTWIIVLGSYGWIGYLATFGLLSFPVLRLRWITRKVQGISSNTAGVAILLMFNLCDLIPNSSLTPLTWLLAGGLLIRRPRPANVARWGSGERPAAGHRVPDLAGAL